MHNKKHGFIILIIAGLKHDPEYSPYAIIQQTFSIFFMANYHISFSDIFIYFLYRRFLSFLSDRSDLQ